MTTTLRAKYTTWVELWRLRLVRKSRAIREGLRYARPAPELNGVFAIVSCERNAGSAALRCLDSVYRQRYRSGLITHFFIDDASDDGTHEMIERWLKTHSGHCVEYIRNLQRRGGTLNTVNGFRMAPAGSIVVELNGDDWLASRGTLQFLGRVYADPAVWMTYNTLSYRNGLPALWARPVPPEVIANNAFREMGEWVTSAPHTFRRELFGHIREETLRDPDTGEYWESADDQAIYLAMLELAGRHARHLHRVTYVYNFRELSHCFHGSDLSEARARRIRQQPKYQPLESL